ncbi:MAG: AAA family ATPase [Alphaproteobacteria bacterium]|nr:AAA family ATPase [Alphaproteobacteria bacterium]
MTWLDSILEAFKRNGGKGKPAEIINLTQKIREENNDTWGDNGLYQVWTDVEKRCKGYKQCGPNPLFEKIEENGLTVWRLLSATEDQKQSLIDEKLLKNVLQDFVRRALIARDRRLQGINVINEELGGHSGKINSDVEYRMSFGFGNIATIPYIAFLGFGQVVPKGIYPVVLFDTTVSNGNFSICYGVSETKKSGLSWPASVVAGKRLYRGAKYKDTYVHSYHTVNTEQDFIDNKEEIVKGVIEVISDFEKVFKTKPSTVLPETENTSSDIASISQPLNQILYGAPGTGKTYRSILKALEIVTGQAKSLPADKAERKAKYAEYLEEMEGYRDQIRFVTFHQSMAYEEFVEGIKPVIKQDGIEEGESSQVQYTNASGIFKNIVNEAKANRDKKYVLIIDEINRGNISKIFGELITLIEPSKRLWNEEPMTVTLPYSQEPFNVPNNLYLIGTMNTSDRSIAAVDIALRRRFFFVPMRPEDNLVTDVQGIYLHSIFKNLNKKIEILLDEDHMIGHSYLMGCKTVAEVKKVWFDEIMPLLNEYFYGDWDRLSLVLGDDFVVQQDIPVELRDFCNAERFSRFAKVSEFSDTEFVNAINKLG